MPRWDVIDIDEDELLHMVLPISCDNVEIDQVDVVDALNLLETEIVQLQDEIDEWKDATLLSDSSGDPGDIIPKELEDEIERLRSIAKAGERWAPAWLRLISTLRWWIWDNESNCNRCILCHVACIPTRIFPYEHKIDCPLSLGNRLIDTLRAAGYLEDK